MLAAQQPALAELRPGDPALRARHRLLRLGRQAGVVHHEIGQQFIDWHMRLGAEPFALGGALFAQMLFDLLAVFDFGQMDGRLLAAGFALHG